MALVLNVNSEAVVKFTNQLERINRSAFPVAVREALNSAAFDVKKFQLPISAERNFVKRQPNFFKANSRVEMAKGWSLSEMVAKVGMIDLGGSNYAVDDLEQQEHGGKIDAKSFIPLDSARNSNSAKKIVAPRNRLSKIKNIVRAAKTEGVSEAQRFIKSVISAGSGGFILSERGVLWKIDSMNKKTPLYSFKKGRSVNVKPTHFMQEATEASAKKIDEFYILAAEKQFERQLSKF